jgi:patatin-related protein
MNPEPAPVFAPDREVRLAVVMYGGVSLAIYINGVVQELLRMVRATAPVMPPAEAVLPPAEQRAYFPDAALTGSERVYRRLGQLPVSGPLPGTPPPDGSPIRTRFVVDILSGTSAGGINAIFLAKALANQQDVGMLRKLWIDEADIGELLNDRRGVKGLTGVPVPKPPRSLLSGPRLFVKALVALRGMESTSIGAGDDTRPAYADQVDLAVTTTDLQGLVTPIQLADRVVPESRHRHVFRFHYATEGAMGEHRNDFVAEMNGLLAFAARCTSSFPFAFEPSRLADVTDLPDVHTPPDGWAQAFPDHARAGADFTRYAFADGGYLDNKPFSYATEGLRRRRSDYPVDRRLLYIEPDPSGPAIPPDAPLPGPGPAKPPPDALGNAAAGVLDLPRQETIREDIAAIVERNRAIRGIRDITRRFEDAILTGDDPLAPLAGLDPDAPDAVADAALGAAAFSHRAYRILRVDVTLGDLAGTVAALSELQDGSEEAHAVRLLLGVWFDREHAGAARAFLRRFDLAFRMRRLYFLQDRINDLLRGGERSARLAAFGGATPADVAAADVGLRRLKVELNDIATGLRVLARTLRDGTSPGTVPVRAALAASAIDRATLLAVLQGDPATRSTAADDGPGLAAALLAEPGTDAALDAAAAALAAAVEAPVRTAEAATAARLAAVEPAAVAGLLGRLYERFESFDAIALPLGHPDLGETNPVEILRIAPQDAPSLVREDGAKRKLAGIAYGHFGGFLDARWRHNDLMWGRLDAAERLVAMLVPPGALRTTMREAAHAAILREELPAIDPAPLPADDAELIAHFRDTFVLPPPPPPAESVPTMRRGAAITGQIFEDLSERHGVPTTPWFWLTRVMRLSWGFVELAIPRSAPSLAGLALRYWAQLALIVAVVLVVAGALGIAGAGQVGWILGGGVLAALALAAVLRSMLAGHKGWQAALGLVGVAILVLAGLELSHIV